MLRSETIIHDRYRIVRLIGEGGAGAVYEAIDLHLSKTVALKQTRIPHSRILRSFEQEARILSRIQHPALAQVTDYFSEADSQFLVMTFIPGADLGELLEQRDEPFSVETVLDWAEQLLDVLEYLHSQRSPIIHRDIKPQNLKLTPEGRLILLDFGLAKGAITSQNAYTTTRSIVGYTLQFTAPEQLQSKGTDHRSDIYSLAATLYCLMTGTTPAGAMERTICAAGNLADPLQPAHIVNPQIPHKVSAVLMRAMAQAPIKRYASISEFREAFHEAYRQSLRVSLPRAYGWLWPAVGGIVASSLVAAALIWNLSGATNTSQADAQITLPVTTATPLSVTNISEQGAKAQAATAPLATIAPTIAPTSLAAPIPTLCSAEQIKPTSTQACYGASFEARMQLQGYEKNIVTFRAQSGLRVSQSNNSMWLRDLSYATRGYSYVLQDMKLLRQSIETFILSVNDKDMPPEAYIFEWDRPKVYSSAWDGSPNLIHAVYTYVAKTGDRAFYQQHRPTLLRLGQWIASLDADGDGLPDPANDRYPFGYFNSVTNGVRHTYALAKFYAAYQELAELEEFADQPGDAWRLRATTLRTAFHDPAHGYWPAGQTWPIAWFRADAPPVTLLETFGVFEALRSGLIAPEDGAHYSALMRTLHARLPELLDGPTPLRLAVGGYPAELRRDVEPPVPLWMLDASAPWIVGLAAPAYAAAGYPADAEAIMQAYTRMATTTDPPVLEFAAGAQAQYGAGDTGDRGRSWDSSAWFLAIYQGHYGLTLTPRALIVQPRPFADRPDDGVHNFTYQGATIQLSLDARQNIYTLTADRPVRLVFRPMHNTKTIQVDGGQAQAEATIQLEPDHTYITVSK